MRRRLSIIPQLLVFLVSSAAFGLSPSTGFSSTTGALTWRGDTSTANGPIPGTSAGTITGILLAVGDRVTFAATGTVNTLPPDPAGNASPDGNPFPCTPACQLPSAKFGALIGKIGTDGSWFLVGSSKLITANRRGGLILGINDTIHNNNTGSFNVTVSVEGTLTPCVPGPSTLCLAEGRFRVEVAWRNSGQTGFGNAAACGTADSGLVWFFAQTNWEMLVKIINGCGLNSRYWVFMAATTNVEFTLRVTDTETGAVQQYFNPLGRLAPPLADTGAFATCP
ncbi:MAG TPA: hypothetical protein DD490_13825 [Acidobacteria bacterium]|nr:hypothetical protein [Acidobacteriota bacterium]